MPGVCTLGILPLAPVAEASAASSTNRKHI